MRYRLGVEDVEPDHWVAWVFELPGCFASARTVDEAIAGAPARIAEHRARLAAWGQAAPLADEHIAVEVAEVFRAFPFAGDPSYSVNAFFADDRRPLTRADVDRGLWLLDGSRRELLAALERLGTPGPAGAEDAVGEILAHVAQAEWWYFDRLGLACERGAMPEDLLGRLAAVRAQTRRRLPELAGDDRVVTRAGERWSARKVLRRTLWHEQDHLGQIGRLLAT